MPTTQVNPSAQNITQYNIQTGGANNNLNNVAPSSTSGVPVISQGAASQPVFGTAVVAGGGTGAVTLTQHGVLLGQGTSAVTATAVGATGTVLAGNTGADPTFQTLATIGAITTITGNSGGAESPSSGNFNILGTGSITVAGSANTETVQLTGLTNHNVQVGAGTATLTQVAPSATSGIPLVSNGSSSDPSFTTAVVAGGGTGATSFNTNGAVISGTSSTAALAAVSLSAQQFLVGNSGAPTAKAFSIAVQTFTTTGTYTPTSGMVYCVIECVGGGGGGGGAPSTGGSTVGGGGGGGAGEYAIGVFSSATIGASQSVTIGAAGTANSGTTGGNGGNSSVGSTLISANGGSGGLSNSVNGSIGVGGGAGGTGGTGGSYRVAGNPGSPGFLCTNTNSIWVSGQGANSKFGNGGPPQIKVSSAGNAGAGNGTGGGGGANDASQSANLGGVGTKGIVVITEYVIS